MTDCVVGFSLFIIIVDRTYLHHVVSCLELGRFSARFFLSRNVMFRFANEFTRTMWFECTNRSCPLIDRFYQWGGNSHL